LRSANVTPEERAGEVVFELGLGFDPSSVHESDREIVAAAIRVAENDALERAARVADELDNGEAASAIAAMAIRAMKHPN
jgi:hypothetical protein